MTSEIEDAKNSTQKNSGMSGSPGSSSTPKRHQAFSPESSDLVDFIANFDGEYSLKRKIFLEVLMIKKIMFSVIF